MVANYSIVVCFMAYDTIVVTADTLDGAKDEVRRVLLDEQRYEQCRIRPVLAQIQSIREEDADSEVIWRRGEDPLKRLVVEAGSKEPES